jgi:hypothetical protein
MSRPVPVSSRGSAARNDTPLIVKDLVRFVPQLILRPARRTA